MANWWDSYPDAPAPTPKAAKIGGNWWDSYPNAPTVHDRFSQGTPGSGGRPPPRPDQKQYPGIPSSGYVGESLEGISEIPGAIAQGARETVMEVPERYREGYASVNREGPGSIGTFKRVLGAPLAGAYNAVAGSPAGELATDIVLSGAPLEFPRLPLKFPRRMTSDTARSASVDGDLGVRVGEVHPGVPATPEGGGVAPPQVRQNVPILALPRPPPRLALPRPGGKPVEAGQAGGALEPRSLGAAANPARPPGRLAEDIALTFEQTRPIGPAGRPRQDTAASSAMRRNEEVAAKTSPEDEKALGDALTPSPFSLGAAKTTQDTSVKIKPGKGIWGRPTAGRNLIRQQIGIKEQDTARQNLAFEQFRRLSNEATVQENIDTIRYMQHRSTDGPLGKVSVDQKFQGVSDEIRRGYIAREADLKSLDEFTRMQFEEDHFTQKWQDPRKAKEVWDGWRGREGSTGFAKHKKYLDFDAGLAAGLTPKSFNIVDVAMNDFANMDRVIAMARTREIAEDQGYIKWAENSRQVPSDWVPLKGYGAERGNTRAFAPADFARNYNNFVGRGFNDTSLAGTVQGLRATTNGLTQLELGFSAYHVTTIARESLATGVADTVYAMSHAHPWQAAKNLAKTSASPVYYAAQGRKAGQIYLGTSPGSQFESRAIEALVQANAHLGQLEPALLSGKTRSLLTQFHRGAIAKDVANSFRHIREADGFFRTTGTTAVEAGRAVGEVMNTISAPLFQHYIPAVKRGMMMDQMVQFLKSHPTATWEEIVTEAQTVSDIADERFGEMKQDNLFWDPMVKQAAQISMRSTSWAYGSWTQYAGGVKELASIPSKGLGRRTSYLFADAFTTALIGGMTTYLMTGKRPDDWRDFIWGKTGGTTTVHAGKRTYKVDERVNLPGSIKEIVGVTAAIMDVKDYGSLSGFADYARNKENDFIKTMGEVVTNQDWRGAPLINPLSKESILKQWFNVGVQAFGPISLKQEQPDAGSKLNFPGSSFLGFRPAGRRWIDPEGYKQGVDARLQRAAKQNESYQSRRAADRKPRMRHEDAAVYP